MWCIIGTRPEQQEQAGASNASEVSRVCACFVFFLLPVQQELHKWTPAPTGSSLLFINSYICSLLLIGFFYFEVTVVLLHVCVRACVFVHMDVALFSLSHYIPQTCLCYNHSTTASLTPSPVQETPWSLGSISVTRSGPSVFCCHLDLN